jgi:hypothetical protein
MGVRWLKAKLFQVIWIFVLEQHGKGAIAFLGKT